MSLKWIGAVLILCGTGGVGLAIACGVQREAEALRQLLIALEFMESELEYRLTPLPELCRRTAERVNGCVSRFFAALAAELEGQIAPDASACTCVVLRQSPALPPKTAAALGELGRGLGNLNLDGQLRQLRAAQKSCRETRRQLEEGKQQRLRSYQTLGLCAGAALAILLL
ncbi:MAG: stage III sporulation protein AB [Firmicutes bacterium]|nr:stage III sporulation protein AB [Bacillota bacterium]